MRKVTTAFMCVAFAAASLMSAAPAAAQDLCPYDTSGNYTYDAAANPTYLFYGDGQITYDGSIAWYMDDVMACYNTYKTPGYGVYFPKCDLNGNGSVEIAEVYDIYYRIHPVNQTDRDAQTICAQHWRTGPFFFCYPSRYDRVVADKDAILANYPVTTAIYDGASGSLGQQTLQWEYDQLRCSTPGAFNPAAFDALNACYLATTVCDDMPCNSATIDFSQAVDPYMVEQAYSDVAQNFGGVCQRVAAEFDNPVLVPGIQSRTYTADSAYWIYEVRATAQCVGNVCACDHRYELYTHKDYTGNVYLMNETNNSTAACTDDRFPGSTGCPDADGDGVCDADDQCPGENDLLDSDGDATPDCLEECDTDPLKTVPGICGCGVEDFDTDGDGSFDCLDACYLDPNKIYPGVCGCGVADIDSDGDGFLNCEETCDNDPNKTMPGDCGCGTPDTDTDGDGVADCNDPCPNDNPDDPDGDGECGVAAATPNCDDLAGTVWGPGPPMPLGAAVINGTCQMIFGGSVPAGIALWSNVAECTANCNGCTDNSDCGANEYCKYDDYTCGPVGQGVCAPLGEICTGQYDPVCTCNYTIVSNACYATVWGESIMSDGECAPEDVCNYNGGSWNGTECDCPPGTWDTYMRGCEACTADSDLDGVCDIEDVCPGADDATAPDADGDGVCDLIDVCPGEDDTLDTDADGTPDCLEPCAGIGDADADDVCDDVDNCVNDHNPGQEDADGNGIGDACEETTCTDGTPTLHAYDVGGPGQFGEPGDFAELDGLLYFRARVDGYGEELMAYDPAADDTFLVADIFPGAGGGSPYYLTAHEGKLYFRASDASYDSDLYVYDPVADQVNNIDVNPAGSSNAKDLYSASDGLLYFNARENGDIELYTYNPAGGQVTRYEVYPGTDSYGNPNQGVPKEFLEYNGKIYMSADGTEGRELHSFDMTTKQFQRLTNIASGYSNGRGRSSYPTELTLFNDEIFFNAAKDAALDEELWIYNPATGGVREIEIDSGQNFFQGALVAAGSGPTLFTPYNGKLYMRAQQVPVGIELFVYDPAIDDVSLVWDSAPGTYQQCFGTCLTFGNDGHTSYLTLFNDVFYFTAPFDNKELWYYDPAIDDGGQLMEIYPGLDQWGNLAQGEPYEITAFNDRLFFRASDPNYDLELFSVSWDCP